MEKSRILWYTFPMKIGSAKWAIQNAVHQGFSPQRSVECLKGDVEQREIRMYVLSEMQVNGISWGLLIHKSTSTATMVLRIRPESNCVRLPLLQTPL